MSYNNLLALIDTKLAGLITKVQFGDYTYTAFQITDISKILTSNKEKRLDEFIHELSILLTAYHSC